MEKEKFIELVCNDCICCKTCVDNWKNKQEECMKSIIMAGDGNFFDKEYLHTYSAAKINKIIEQIT